MTQRKRNSKDAPKDDTFYEAMPATARPYGFGGDMAAEEEPVEELSDRNQLTVDDTKTTAIVTLILTGLVAIGLALLFMRGLDTIRGVNPQTTTGTEQLR